MLLVHSFPEHRPEMGPRVRAPGRALCTHSRFNRPVAAGATYHSPRSRPTDVGVAGRRGIQQRASGVAQAIWRPSLTAAIGAVHRHPAANRNNDRRVSSGRRMIFSKLRRSRG